jgi:hypothetical protein
MHAATRRRVASCFGGLSGFFQMPTCFCRFNLYLTLQSCLTMSVVAVKLRQAQPRPRQLRSISELYVTIVTLLVMCSSLAALESSLDGSEQSHETTEEAGLTRQQKWAFLPHTPASVEAIETHRRTHTESSSIIQNIDALNVNMILPVGKGSLSSIETNNEADTNYEISEPRGAIVDPVAHAAEQHVVRDDRTLLDVFAESTKDYLTRQLVRLTFQALYIARSTSASMARTLGTPVQNSSHLSTHFHSWERTSDSSH